MILVIQTLTKQITKKTPKPINFSKTKQLEKAFRYKIDNNPYAYPRLPISINFI